MSDAIPARKNRAFIEKAIQSTPIGRLIGFTITDAIDGRASGSLQPGPQHANPMGTLHGGVLCDLADATMGMAFASTLEDGESFTTMDLQIQFFRPVWNSLLRSEARVIHRSRNTGYIECEIREQSGKLVAKSGSKCIVLRGEAAKGR